MLLWIQEDYIFRVILYECIIAADDHRLLQCRDGISSTISIHLEESLIQYLVAYGIDQVIETIVPEPATPETPRLSSPPATTPLLKTPYDTQR
jgi:hypothetical protein